jgi:hypothetical protein
MKTGHSITVVCEKGSNIARWSSNGSDPAVVKAQKGDTVSFTIDAPGTVVQATLMSGPRALGSKGPLFGGNPIDLMKKQPLSVGNSVGRWGFAIAIETQQDGISSFYFLPDPELEVGSTGT